MAETLKERDLVNRLGMPWYEFVKDGVKHLGYMFDHLTFKLPELYDEVQKWNSRRAQFGKAWYKISNRQDIGARSIAQEFLARELECESDVSNLVMRPDEDDDDRVSIVSESFVELLTYTGEPDTADSQMTLAEALVEYDKAHAPKPVAVPEPTRILVTAPEFVSRQQLYLDPSVTYLTEEELAEARTHFSEDRAREILNGYLSSLNEAPWMLQGTVYSEFFEPEEVPEIQDMQRVFPNARDAFNTGSLQVPEADSHRASRRLLRAWRTYVAANPDKLPWRAGLYQTNTVENATLPYGGVNNPSPLTGQQDAAVVAEYNSVRNTYLRLQQLDRFSNVMLDANEISRAELRRPDLAETEESPASAPAPDLYVSQYFEVDVTYGISVSATNHLGRLMLARYNSVISLRLLGGRVLYTTNHNEVPTGHTDADRMRFTVAVAANQSHMETMRRQIYQWMSEPIRLPDDTILAAVRILSVREIGEVSPLGRDAFPRIGTYDTVTSTPTQVMSADAPPSEADTQCAEVFLNNLRSTGGFDRCGDGFETLTNEDTRVCARMASDFPDIVDLVLSGTLAPNTNTTLLQAVYELDRGTHNTGCGERVARRRLEVAACPERRQTVMTPPPEVLSDGGPLLCDAEPVRFTEPTEPADPAPARFDTFGSDVEVSAQELQANRTPRQIQWPLRGDDLETLSQDDLAAVNAEVSGLILRASRRRQAQFKVEMLRIFRVGDQVFVHFKYLSDVEDRGPRFAGDTSLGSVHGWEFRPPRGE